ncbi:DNA ligase 3 BRCT domain [Trinorchestia longiramus]|nr:DNA ligase 3 BRCT domain [Trinorchestia longiramus]
MTSFGGTLVPDYCRSEATHCAGATSQPCEFAQCGARHVRVDWLWDSMKLRRLLPDTSYTFPATRAGSS